jgi:hypothetical protein
MCTDAYREALTRDLSSTASPARANSGQDDLESRAAGAAAQSGPAMALAEDATVVNGEAIPWDEEEPPGVI